MGLYYPTIPAGLLHLSRALTITLSMADGQVIHWFGFDDDAIRLGLGYHACRSLGGPVVIGGLIGYGLVRLVKNLRASGEGVSTS